MRRKDCDRESERMSEKQGSLARSGAVGDSGT